MTTRPVQPPVEPHASVDPVAGLLDLTRAVQAAAALAAAARTGAVQVLSARPRTATDVAAACGTAPRHTALLLTALHALGVLNRDHAGRYHPVQPLAGFVESTRQAWDRAEQVLGSGEPVQSADTGDGAQRFYPDVVAALSVLSTRAAPAAAARLAPAGAVLDVGAGAAPWSIALAQADPATRVTAIDLPTVLPQARAAVARAGLGERFSFRPADMFSTPFDREAYDVVLLANICHLFAAAANTQLLARLAPALRPGGRLVIVDVLPEPMRADHRYSALLALYEFGLSMRTTAGQVHPLDDYDRWARAAGLSGVRVERLGVDPPLSLLIATPTNPRPRATGPMALR